MAQQDQQHIVRIGKEKAALSKTQREFNRLIHEIEKLGIDLQELRETSEHIYRRVQADYRPLARQYSQVRADLVRLLDRAYERNEYNKSEKRKLADLITSMAFELISDYGLDDLKLIYDKYDSQGFDKISTESGVQKAVDYVEEAAEQQQETERHTEKPKSAKQQERAAKKMVEARNITKAVRTVYMDLVKAFHPDREPDETEKQRKTEVMHRVTDAYEKGDLLALLRLQLEFDRIDQTHLESLAEQQLNYYNKILRQQALDLNKEFVELQTELATMMGRPVFAANSRIALEFSLNSDIAELKRDIKQLKSDAKALADADILRQWLKNY